MVEIAPGTTVQIVQPGLVVPLGVVKGDTGATGATGAPGGSDAATADWVQNGPLTSAALSATYAPVASPVTSATAANTDALNGGSAGGKKVMAGETSAGKLVFEIATAEPSNGYTTLNLFPSTAQSRTKISVWAKSPDDLTGGETNHRLFSLEAHSVAEEGVSHATLYAQMKPGMTTQNGRGTVAAGGPLLDYQGHVFQFATEDQWDNRFELLTFLQAKGGFPDDLWQASPAVYAGVSDVGGYPTLQLATSDATKLNRIQNRNGLFEFVTSSAGSMKFNTPGGIVLTGSQVYVDDSSTGIRVRGVLGTTNTNAGVHIGRISTDVSQPVIRISNGTAAQEAVIDNRTGRMRFIVGATVPFAVEDGKVGFYGTNPIAKQTLGVAATDAATTQTLVNDIRTKLIALGLMA